MSRRVKDLRDLSNDHFGPMRIHTQSRYVEGFCEKCGGWIATNEEHLTRAWLNGPAEQCQHVECPTIAVGTRVVYMGRESLKGVGTVTAVHGETVYVRFDGWTQTGTFRLADLTPTSEQNLWPVGSDTDGNGIWTDGFDAWNSGEPLTPEEASEAEARTHP